MTTLNYKQFQELVGNSAEGISLKAKGEDKIIIDFFADWCGPCRMQTSVLNEFSEKGVKVYKVDVDDDTKLAEEFGVRSIPTLLFLNPLVKMCNVRVFIIQNNLNKYLTKFSMSHLATEDFAEVISTLKKSFNRAKEESLELECI